MRWKSLLGISVWNEHSPKIESALAENKMVVDSKLTRKESYKAQRKSYRKEKKRVASELLNSLQDPAVIVLADWLKVRGTLKSWTKLWCVLKPGLLLLYKSPKIKSSSWVGTVVLTSCQVIERPSKKDGFCFKLFHPLDQSIWAPRGPEKETMGAVTQPLPTSYLIFRAPSQAAGKCWMDALELSLRCSALLVRSFSTSAAVEGEPLNESAASGTSSHETQWSDADYEKHFNEHGGNLSPLLRIFASRAATPATIGKTFFPQSPCPSPTPLFQQLYQALGQIERMTQESPDAYLSVDYNTEKIVQRSNSFTNVIENAVESGHNRRQSYPLNVSKIPTKVDIRINNKLKSSTTVVMSAGETESESENEPIDQPDECQETAYIPQYEDEFGAAGEQVEELAEEHKSLIWFLVKQVRPGMDLSKVVLPTFILEPRSFLDKLSDSFYHADIISKAVIEDDPFIRMKLITQWYLSGFYKKPKGLKKPFNPILGETFRCFWQHPNGSRTFYLAEQVSHHPPVSAFYMTNRQDGFCLSCSILAKSKFYGNSTSAILEGVGNLTLLPRGEHYTLNSPYAYCKGILMGTLTMELGGKVTIECENTGYKTELEFKLKPFLGGNEYTNLVTGKLKLGKQTMASINGHWDGKIMIKDARTNEESVLFAATPEMKQQRLKRFTVQLEAQASNESERLWQHVIAAIKREDQVGATEEKTALEEAQRTAVKERKATCTEWIPKHFQQDLVTGQWHYVHADLRPWDLRNDVRQYENNYKIQTKTKHQAPIVRTASIVSSEPLSILKTESRNSLAARRALSSIQNAANVSTPTDHIDGHSDSSGELEIRVHHNKLSEALDKINHRLDEQHTAIANIQKQLSKVIKQDTNSRSFMNLNVISLVILAIGIVFHGIFMWMLSKKQH
ncbi:oxysterol-binding protein-related protein 8 isoform X3 [Chironomus tepperi]|uniref:oxysterol-binding protein-related protein 8 isoform X3 n=1 Tax=Chironomus tepperi TaxID=113505 RepID=UPI00391EF6DF